jgi:flagella basal body P-ring formation protein FlgA
VPVFRAPDLGQTGAVAVARVAEALRPYDITSIDTAGLTEVVVTRLSRPISRKDIIDRIAQAFAGQYGFGDAENLSVTLDRDVRTMNVEANVTADLSVTHMNVDPRTGRFDISFELPGSVAARRLPLRFTGSVAETVEAATLIRTVRPGETLKASDVSMERRPKSEVGNELMTAAQAVGLAARQTMRAGQVLRPGDLMRPQVVQRNESVTLTYTVPGIVLTVRGKALEAGAVDDVVSVLNIQSNRTIQATVTGPGRVAVASPVAAQPAPVADLASNDPVSRRTQ